MAGMTVEQGLQLASSRQCRALLFLLLDGWRVERVHDYQIDHVRYPVFEVGRPGSRSGLVRFDGRVSTGREGDDH